MTIQKTRMLSPSRAKVTTHSCRRCGVAIRPKQTPAGTWYITAYCSRSCAAFDRAERRFGVRKPQTCAYVRCGKRFIRPPGSPNRKYCSKPCSEQAIRLEQGWVRKRHGYPVFWTGKAEVLVHRIVMEGQIGRPLREGETVHHINGDKMDWRPENLELWDGRHGPGQRVADKIAWAISFLLDYEMGVYSFADPHHITPPAVHRW